MTEIGEGMVDYDKEKLIKVSQKYKLSLVILHGSYAKGVVLKESDIDIAVLGESGSFFKEKYFDIVADLTEIFGEKCDPVFLNGAEALLAYYIALSGIPLYEKEKGTFNIFKVSAIARYMDTKKFRLLEKSYIKSLLYEAR